MFQRNIPGSTEGCPICWPIYVVSGASCVRKDNFELVAAEDQVEDALGHDITGFP